MEVITGKLRKIISISNLGVCIFILLAAAAFTHALIPLQNLAHSSLYGDILILGYVLTWGCHALFHSPLSYYDAPIFYPSHNMLPGTDGIELPALLLSPVWYIFRNPILLVNLTIFAAHLFALTSAYVCSRRVFSLPKTWCLILAIFFAITSDRLCHSTGHLNLIWSGILPLIFTGVWFSLEKPNVSRTALLAISLGCSVYLSVYFFVLGALMAVIAAVLFFSAKLQPLRARKMLIICAAVVSAVIIASRKILIYKQAALRGTQDRTSLAEECFNGT
jgi:hypothetical protein